MDLSFLKSDLISGIPKSPNHLDVKSTNLNEVMQQSLHRFQTGIRNQNVIVRYESLPIIEADKKAMIRVFDNLVQMIINHPPEGSKLFLYVDCEEESREQDSETLYVSKRYSIRFHTNITTSEEWKAEYQRVLEECSELLNQFGAGFTVNEIKNTGCLFSISLSGKL
jgi:light-regulated signal transduction histidine kinase (bacteriophytochrome)